MSEFPADHVGSDVLDFGVFALIVELEFGSNKVGSELSHAVLRFSVEVALVEGDDVIGRFVSWLLPGTQHMQVHVFLFTRPRRPRGRRGRTCS